MNIPVKHADGSVQHVSPQCRSTYKDEYTNEDLPRALICEAMADELLHLCKDVFECVPLETATKDPDHVLVPRPSGEVQCNRFNQQNMHIPVRGARYQYGLRGRSSRLRCNAALKRNTDLDKQVGERAGAQGLPP